MSQSILAGKTFLEKLEGDPRALESWKWAQAQLKAFSEGVEALRPEFERLDADWLNEFGEPVPHTIEDLQRWLARADVPGRLLPADKIASGKWTAADIMPYVEGYLLRKQDDSKGIRKLSKALAGGDRQSVGRPKNKLTKRRADFAKPLIEDDGLTWPEILAKYQKEQPDDTGATAHIIRLAYQREYPVS